MEKYRFESPFHNSSWVLLDPTSLDSLKLRNFYAGGKTLNEMLNDEWHDGANFKHATRSGQNSADGK